MTDVDGARTDAAWDGSAANPTIVAILKAIAANSGSAGGNKGVKVVTTPTIANTSTLALAANTARRAAILTNPKTAGQTLFIGVTGLTTSAYTVSLEPGDSYIDGDSRDAWYAVVTSSTVVANVTEVS